MTASAYHVISKEVENRIFKHSYIFKHTCMYKQSIHIEVDVKEVDVLLNDLL